MEAIVYNQEGKEAGSVDLPEAIFNRPWNPDLVHQVVVAMQSNARKPVAHVKDRSEVSGGGRKPWRQKGTGRARHGSIRSPLWQGGGQSFGPRNEKDYSKKINKKMKREALFSALAKKFQDGEVLFVEDLSFEIPKTQEAKGILEKISELEGFGDIVSKKENALLIALGAYDENTVKSFRNLNNVKIDELRNLNVLDILKKKYLLITEPEESIRFLENKLTKSAV